MKRISVDNKEIQTSVFGFGCVAMTVHRNEQDALNILETAYECGITHFDVARLYGLGQAESILGKFAKHHRSSITITTKFGLNPPQSLTEYKKLLNIARKTVKNLPFLKSIVNKARAGIVQNRAFSIDEAKKSLETSLRELKTDYLDLWLLHECLPEDADDPDLLEFLDTLVREGKILRYGVGTNYQNIQSILSINPNRHRIFQFEQSIFKNNIQRLTSVNGRTLITHSVLKEVAPIVEATTKYEQITRSYSNQIGIDLSCRQEIVCLLLGYANFCNSNGIVLFSSTQKENIHKNITMLIERNYSEPILKIFLEFLDNVSLLGNTRK